MIEPSSETSPLRKVQLRLLTILEAYDAVCKKFGIPYWLDRGTLLGAVRHRGFVPWDDDIDTGFRKEDYGRLVDALNRSADLFPPGIELHTRETTPGHIHGSPRLVDTTIRAQRKHKILGFEYRVSDSPFLDMFPFQRYVLGDDELRSKARQCYIALRPARIVSGKWFYRLYENALVKRYTSESGEYYGTATRRVPRTAPYDAVFPLSEVEFEGRRFSAPGDPEEYLRHWYGDDFMAPPPARMRWRHLHYENVTGLE